MKKDHGCVLYGRYGMYVMVHIKHGDVIRSLGTRCWWMILEAAHGGNGASCYNLPSQNVFEPDAGAGCMVFVPRRAPPSTGVWCSCSGMPHQALEYGVRAQAFSTKHWSVVFAPTRAPPSTGVWCSCPGVPHQALAKRAPRSTGVWCSCKGVPHQPSSVRAPTKHLVYGPRRALGRTCPKAAGDMVFGLIRAPPKHQAKAGPNAV